MSQFVFDYPNDQPSMQTRALTLHRSVAVLLFLGVAILAGWSIASPAEAQEGGNRFSPVENLSANDEGTAVAPELPPSGSAFSVPPESSVDPAGSANGDGVELTAPPAVSSGARLTDIIKSGGPLMIPIGLCSFLLVVFAFERFISLRRGRIIPAQFTRLFLAQLNDGELDQDAAVILCERDNSPMANVFKAGIQKWGRPAVEVEQAVLDEGERTSNRLRKYLRLLNGIATLSPLFGLLGTVVGMIYAFDSIASAGAGAADPRALIATGISQALLTTAAGLTVAIPALIAYLFFSSRVDKYIMDIDAFGMKVVNLISAEALSSEATTDSASEKKTSRRKKAA